MKSTFSIAGTILLFLGIACSTGCNRTKVEVIDLNKVLDIYDQVVKSKEDPTKTESEQLKASAKENEAETKAFLKLFAEKLNAAKLIKAHIGVDMLTSGTIRGFVDTDKNGTKNLVSSKEPELFTLEFDTKGNRIIATQKVAGQHYRRDHHYHHSGYHRYYYYHYLHSTMWGRQNRYYSPSRPRPNYGTMSMSSPNYHTAAVSRARTAARSSSRSSRSSARGFGRSGSFSGGK